MPEFTPHNRHSIRLKGHDYAWPGAYFVTICAYRYCAYFDEPEINKIIETEWHNSALIRPNIELDEFVIMPNHFHGILIIRERFHFSGAVCRGVRGVCNTPLHSINETNSENKRQSPSQTLGAIIRGFKGAVTKKVNIWRLAPDMPLWQRNYYECIIFNKAELEAYRKYIRENPSNWDKDEFNPVNFRDGKPPLEPTVCC